MAHAQMEGMLGIQKKKRGVRSVTQTRVINYQCLQLKKNYFEYQQRFFSSTSNIKVLLAGITGGEPLAPYLKEIKTIKSH